MNKHSWANQFKPIQKCVAIQIILTVVGATTAMSEDATLSKPILF